MPGGIIPRADLRPSSRPPVRKAFRYPWLRDRSLNRILANPERPFSEAAPQKRGTTENSVQRSLQNFSRGDVNINNEIYIKNQHPATATPGKRQHPKTSTPVQFLKNTTSAISIYLQQGRYRAPVSGRPKTLLKFSDRVRRSGRPLPVVPKTTVYGTA